MQQTAKQSRIPEQQGIGQTLPPVPVGIDALNAPPLPPGAMPAGTRLQVGKYQVIVHNFIAEGGFAHVYIARIEGKSGYVVLKRVAVPDGERLKMVEKEIAFMRRLGDHKNIVRYYESRIDALPVGGFEALILMEYCPGGGVIDLMNRRLQQRLTEPEILKIFSDVAEALAYMHYCNPPVLHRDLKVENILILNQDHYKLCDFGSASLSKGGYIPTTLRDVQKLEDDIQRHTTLQYRAPEMIDVYQKKPVNEKADIWAMGVLLYKLCYYTTPFEEEGQLAILNARYNIPNSPIFSDGLRHLIVSMLQEDQNRRPNIYQVMNAVCRLRGIDCPIRDIYSEPIITPPYGQQQPYQQFQQSPSTTNGSSDSGSIFEKVPSPPQELPNITPMRRGRPTKPERTSAAASPVVENRTPTKTFDPFDPSHVNKNTSPTSPSASSTANATPPTSFQNSFIPEPSSSTTFKKPSTASTSSSFKKTPVTSTSSSFKKTPVTSTSSSLKNNSTTSSDSFKSHRATSATSSPSPSHVQSVPVTHHMALKPQMATKILQTQPNSPANAEERPKKQAESNLDNDGDDKDNGDNDNNDEGNKDMPKINRGVSSSIEARFMAIKNASRNSNHSVKPTPTVSSNAKKNKPAPPPKPARFRSQQIPSVDDFENKFPSLEDLDKSII